MSGDSWIRANADHPFGRIAAALSGWPAPVLYLGEAVGDDDCKATRIPRSQSTHPTRTTHVRAAGTASGLSPMWRGGCHVAWVGGHCVVGAGAGWCGCGWRGGPGVSRGSRRLVMLIFGDWAPQDFCSSHVRGLKSSAPARRVGAQATNRGVGCASRDDSDRLASGNGLWRGFQRELVSLLRMVGVGAGAGAGVG
jgi:hypothetical protein